MRKLIYLVILIVCAIVIVRLTASIYELWHKKDLLTTEQNQLIQEKKENSDLKKGLKIVESKSFIEEEARNKLFLVKPGENTLLIDKSLLKKVPGPKTAIVQKPIWQQWWNLFF